MSRQLSLSQAARLIGVKRTDIQKKIQENKLVVMEGTVTLEDLKIAFPDAQYEDNTIIEKMEKLMENAVHKMAMHEREGSQVDSLSRRLVKVNKELAEERQRAESMEELIDTLKERFMELEVSQEQGKTINSIKTWFRTACKTLESEKLITPVDGIEDQIKQFILPHVRLLPSHHDYVAEPSQSLLESALRSGLAVNYGCNNGNCGKCRARLISGEVEKINNHDYTFTESEKAQGYILTCSNSAVTDVTLETEEAVSADDIPLQTISAKVKHIARKGSDVVILDIQTPRSRRLRFLAGQRVELILDDHFNGDGQPVWGEYSIASCPCEPRNLQFHIPENADNKFASVVSGQLRNYENITIHGPSGNFVLDEDSANSLIFIAWDTGFAPVKSLIEHAISLDHADNIHLYWLTSKVEDHYFDNLCRSWSDALDNFSYSPLVSEPKIDKVAESLIKHLHSEHKHLHNHDLYVAAPRQLNQVLKSLFKANGVKSNNMHFESVAHSAGLKE